MIRKPHRVNFRLTPAEYARYGSLIYPLPTAVPGCWNWTRLVLKALEELYQYKKGRDFPLASAPAPDVPHVDLSDVSIPPAETNGHAKTLVKKLARTVKPRRTSKPRALENKRKKSFDKRKRK